MLHPVGPLPASVYWRRRLVVLALLAGVLGGGGWLGSFLVGRAGGSTPAAATSTAHSAVPTPALERVVPTLADVRTPDVASGDAAASESAASGAEPCTDDMLSLQVRTPGTVAVGSKPRFELVVKNSSTSPCVRTLDKSLQELLLLDATGHRIWGSNDCFPEASKDTRTLAPGEAVTFPVVWGGLTSEPTCTAKRVPPPAGKYVVRGRLDTKASADASLTLR